MEKIQKYKINYSYNTFDLMNDRIVQSILMISNDLLDETIDVHKFRFELNNDHDSLYIKCIDLNSNLVYKFLYNDSENRDHKLRKDDHIKLIIDNEEEEIHLILSTSL